MWVGGQAAAPWEFQWQGKSSSWSFYLILAISGDAKGRVVFGAGAEQHMAVIYLAHQTLYTHQAVQKPKERETSRENLLRWMWKSQSYGKLYTICVR